MEVLNRAMKGNKIHGPGVVQLLRAGIARTHLSFLSFQFISLDHRARWQASFVIVRGWVSYLAFSPARFCRSSPFPAFYVFVLGVVGSASSRLGNTNHSLPRQRQPDGVGAPEWITRFRRLVG